MTDKELIPGNIYEVEVTDPVLKEYYGKKVKVKWNLFWFASLVNKNKILFLSQVKVIDKITDLIK
ncbi:MAG: hypothetical protein KKB34_10290 [Bacteroidetes bacterium]|nr:hypothetical protein [Bacteroidota bacterium]